MTMEGADAIEALLRGWLWHVYARHSDDGTVAAAIAADEGEARRQVQDVLRCQEDLAGYGIVVDLATGARAGCWRNGDGFAWRPVA